MKRYTDKKIIATVVVLEDSTVTRTYETASWYTTYALPKGTTGQIVKYQENGGLYISFDGEGEVIKDYATSRLLHVVQRDPSRVGRKDKFPSIHTYEFKLRRELANSDDSTITIMGVQMKVTLV